MRKKLFTLFFAIVASIVTAWGQFNIPDMNESDEIIIYQNCSLNTEVRETLPKKFTHATISYSYNTETWKAKNVVSDTFDIATVTATGESIKGCIIKATLEFFPEGFYYNNNGKLEGPSTGYIMRMPGYIAYTDYGMNPNVSDGRGGKIFSKPEDHLTFEKGTWKTTEEIKYPLAELI